MFERTFSASTSRFSLNGSTSSRKERDEQRDHCHLTYAILPRIKTDEIIGTPSA